MESLMTTLANQAGLAPLYPFPHPEAWKCKYALYFLRPQTTPIIHAAHHLHHMCWCISVHVNKLCLCCFWEYVHLCVAVLELVS